MSCLSGSVGGLERAECHGLSPTRENGAELAEHLPRE